MSATGPIEEKADAKGGFASASEGSEAKHGSEEKGDSRSSNGGAAEAAAVDEEEVDAGLVSRAVSFYIDNVSLGRSSHPILYTPPP